VFNNPLLFIVKETIKLTPIADAKTLAFSIQVTKPKLELCLTL